MHGPGEVHYVCSIDEEMIVVQRNGGGGDSELESGEGFFRSASPFIFSPFKFEHVCRGSRSAGLCRSKLEAVTVHQHPFGSSHFLLCRRGLCSHNCRLTTLSENYRRSQSILKRTYNGQWKSREAAIDWHIQLKMGSSYLTPSLLGNLRHQVRKQSSAVSETKVCVLSSEDDVSVQLNPLNRLILFSQLFFYR
jgi:hypothetical protein